MKTLKKTLALMLVVAMMFSFGVIGASAAFDDAKDVNADYAEAVEVMSDLGIIKGLTDTTFGPDSTLTRAQACMFIARITLGTDTAAKLTASSKSFTDVAADYWGYDVIEYCYNAGLIAGYGDGKFGPDDALSSYAFAKMLMAALGVDVSACTGANWQIETAKLFVKTGFSKLVLTAGDFTREVAAQIIYDALFYTTDGSTGYPVIKTATGAVVAVYDTVAEATMMKTALGADYSVGSSIVTIGGSNLAKSVFGVTKTPNSTDSFGRIGTKYVASTKAQGAAYGWTAKTKFVANAAVVTYTSRVQEKTVFADLGADGYAGTYAKFVILTSIWEDGVKYDGVTSFTNASTYTVANTAFKESAVIAKNDASWLAGSGNGVKLEIYATATENQYVAVAVKEYFGTVSAVTKANATTGADRYITVDGLTFETEDFAVKDAVIYTKAAGVVTSVVAAEVVSGACSKITSAGVYTIGGVDCMLSQEIECAAPAISTTAGAWYVDTYGNIIAPKSAAAKTYYYGYLLDYAAQDYSATLLGGTKDAAEIFKFVDASGATVTLNGAFTTDATTGKVTKFVASGNVDALAFNSDINYGLFKYSLDASGKIATYKAAASEAVSADTTLTKSTAMFDGKYMTDKTVAFYVNSTTATKAAVYTGYTNMPTKTVASGQTYYYFTNDTTGALEAVMLKLADIAGSTAANYVYFASAAYSAETTSAGTVYTYANVYVNGVAGELKFSAAQVDVAGKLYTYTTNTTTGLSTLSAVTTVSVAITSINSTYFVAGSAIYTDANTLYFVVDMTNKTVAAADALTALATNGEYSVNLFYNDKGTAADSAADVVYFYVGA